MVNRKVLNIEVPGEVSDADIQRLVSMFAGAQVIDQSVEQKPTYGTLFIHAVGSDNQQSKCSRTSVDPNHDMRVITTALEMDSAIARGVDITPDRLYQLLIGRPYVSSTQITDDRISVKLSDMQTLLTAIHDAGVVMDAIPTRWQLSEDSTTRNIGELVNTKGAYHRVRHAERVLRYLLANTNAAEQPTKLTTTDVTIALSTLTAAMRDDSSYAWSWHCNIAMSIQDATGATHLDSNYAAAQIMRHVFNIDVQQFSEWAAFDYGRREELSVTLRKLNCSFYDKPPVAFGKAAVEFWMWLSPAQRHTIREYARSGPVEMNGLDETSDHLATLIGLGLLHCIHTSISSENEAEVINRRFIGCTNLGLRLYHHCYT